MDYNLTSLEITKNFFRKVFINGKKLIKTGNKDKYNYRVEMR